jgi:hypothetical protein
VHHRLCEAWLFACRQALQLHVSAQLQTSPHWHEAAGGAAVFWQPHWHWEPTQTAHAQTFDWGDMSSSFV